MVRGRVRCGKTECGLDDPASLKRAKRCEISLVCFNKIANSSRHGIERLDLFRLVTNNLESFCQLVFTSMKRV